MQHSYKTMSSGYRYRVDSRRIVYEHREVLFNKIGLGPHLCFYCHKPINWAIGNNRSKRTDRTWSGVLVVEHLNGVKDDNRPENLQPACGPCNLIHRAERKRHDALVS